MENSFLCNPTPPKKKIQISQEHPQGERCIKAIIKRHLHEFKYRGFTTFRAGRADWYLMSAGAGTSSAMAHYTNPARFNILLVAHFKTKKSAVAVKAWQSISREETREAFGNIQGFQTLDSQCSKNIIKVLIKTVCVFIIIFVQLLLSF